MASELKDIREFVSVRGDTFDDDQVEYIKDLVDAALSRQREQLIAEVNRKAAKYIPEEHLDALLTKLREGV